MKLVTKKVAQNLPRIYSNDGDPKDETDVVVKFFDPMGSYAWYATEADALVDGEWTELTGDNYRDAEDIKFFGYVDGQFGELGYFTLRQLKSVSGIGIERDRHFSEDRTLADVM
jgi:hypothetical protein